MNTFYISNVDFYWIFGEISFKMSTGLNPLWLFMVRIRVKGGGLSPQEPTITAQIFYYFDQSTGYTIRGSNPGRGKRFFSSTKKVQIGSEASQSHIQWMLAFFPRVKRDGAWSWQQHLYLVQRLRMSGYILTLPYTPSWRVQGQVDLLLSQPCHVTHSTIVIAYDRPRLLSNTVFHSFTSIIYVRICRQFLTNSMSF